MSGLEPGFQLGHYRILRSLGSGGMADVYEAQDDHLDRTVALKILPVEYSRNPQLIQRFHKEVRAAAKLNHRNIVTVFEVGQQESWHFFSMRLLTGGDLRRRIERGMAPVEALAILREVADAFAHAHARGFVHRDVKPENIMFDEQGFPVLTDFGIAKALNANTHMTRTGMTMGTPRYLPPEQASGKAVDARADLYSLGVILHEMLTGRPPYEAEESMAVIFKHVTEPIPVMPPDFGRYQPLLEKLMAKDPKDRLGSAEELIRAIDALVPRVPTGELKQSRIGTMENPLIAGLLTPSPLRTAPPRTPQPFVPPARPKPPAADLSGEVVVQAPRVTTREAVAARPATAPAPRPGVAVRPAPAAAPAVAAPARKTAAVAVALAGVAAVAIGAWLLIPDRAAAPVAAPAAAPVAAPATVAPAPDAAHEAAATQERALEQRRVEDLRAAEALAAQRRADELARQRAEQDAARMRAEAAAKKRAGAEAAEVRRREQAEAEARRRAEAEAAAQRRAEQEAAEQQARQQASPTAAEAARKRKEEEAARRAEKKAEEEKKAVERARRPMGF